MVKIRSLRIDDTEKMLDFYLDGEFRKIFLFNRYPKSLENIIDFVRNSWVDKNNIHYAIADENDEYLGTISLKNISYIDKTAEYAIIIRKEFWGQKVGFKATNEILFYAFNILNLNKVYLNVLANNNRAIQFYEKYGFKKEGIFKNHIFHYGEYIDLIWYAIFKDDFKNPD